MPRLSRPRHSSLQYWPRKRARKVLPRVNWNAIASKEGNKDKKLLGFIGYKVGMASVYVRDQTPNSMTKEKRITIPCTLIELPPMKVYSMRFYKHNKVAGEVLAENLDKELKKKVKLPKNKKKAEEINTSDYEKITLIAYSIVKKTGIKRKPDMLEIGLGGNTSEQYTTAKELLGKEINASEFLKDYELVDIRGITTGRGLSGPVKRHGIELKSHKSEKGVRRPGSLAPWHPPRVTFHAPQAGQLGMFTRVTYNNKIVLLDKIEKNNINPKAGFKNYGTIRTEYLVLRGSIQGPSKRAMAICAPLRKTKKQLKKKYEFIEIRQ